MELNVLYVQTELSGTVTPRAAAPALILSSMMLLHKDVFVHLVNTSLMEDVDLAVLDKSIMLTPNNVKAAQHQPHFIKTEFVLHVLKVPPIMH